jgi:hypothetical protein
MMTRASVIRMGQPGQRLHITRTHGTSGHPRRNRLRQKLAVALAHAAFIDPAAEIRIGKARTTRMWEPPDASRRLGLPANVRWRIAVTREKPVAFVQFDDLQRAAPLTQTSGAFQLKATSLDA